MLRGGALAVCRDAVDNPRMARGRTWTPDEDAAIRAAAERRGPDSPSLRTVAARLGRTHAATRKRASRLGVRAAAVRKPAPRRRQRQLIVRRGQWAPGQIVGHIGGSRWEAILAGAQRQADALR